ncbi:type III effector protein [Ralstonia pseudosolanacearum]|uniref:NEL-type E3 ubiquitin ligase domain-containing protein n=1 Tax=Ralstonia pseudosolanacearum TaxID=1310165 RepID=UPI000DAC76A5|nr:NEL-type E3 ubiquitin ligase domain-containing protein [Ralstonia pseudosolanacearum]AZU56173.1 type III effector protein [Ralstonia solanacearum]MCK4136016.1 type III effector protein [Ralstonia pseudosolanacearum]RAA14311.1 type III effector protein [Ralstonia pseudosolanacearum]UQY81226.1 type III effector protein [Ralstonia pseudosolanacearum]
MPTRVPSPTLGRSHPVTGAASTATSTATTATRSGPATAPAPGRSREGLLAELPTGRTARTPSVSAAGAHAGRPAWNVQGAIEAMAALSPEREKRLFKKSASPQYRYAKGLTAEQRGQLESALEQRFRNPAAPAEARDSALAMWLSVQQARLRTHTAGHRNHHNLEQFQLAALSVPIPLLALGYRRQRRRYYSSPLRPEYRTAFNNFMRVIGDPSLSEAVRQTVAQRLEYHRRSEETIARHERQLLGEHGVMGLAESGYQIGTNYDHVNLTALEREAVVESRGSGVPPALHIQALQTERSRVESGALRHQWLTRELRDAQARAGQGGAVAGSAGPSSVRQVDAAESSAAAAETALGTCGDNVADGFANIVTMVDTHQLVDDVRSGKLDQPALEAWGRQRYRLDSLITEVNQWMASRRRQAGQHSIMTERRVAREPLETMLHAKVALKTVLDLPKNLPSSMRHRLASALKPDDLKRLAETVQAKEADPVELARYLLSNDAWRGAMKALHPAAFAALRKRFAPEKDALAKEIPPQPTDPEGLEFLDERMAYAERTDAFTQKCRAAEDTLLLSLAGRYALVPAVVGAGPSQGSR